ncbi:MAG: S9 family peptidase [Symbiobacteriaceae bacterium]|nr:S9 family peptidase [Symbiobacteriaceae bacterium]
MSTKTFTPEDVLRLANIGQVQLAPDGSTVIYELREPDLAADETKTHLWWVATSEGAEPKRITGSGKDNSPSWSHDSQRIAFVSGRGTKPQIYILERSGGEAQVQTTTVRPGGTLQWSKDDRYLAFMSRQEIKIEDSRYPGEPEKLWKSAAEELAGRANARPPEGERRRTPPVRVITAFEYRNDGQGMTYEYKQQLFVLDLQDGSCKQLTKYQDSEFRLGGFTWGKDHTIIFTQEHFDLEQLHQETTVFSLGLDQEEPTQLFKFSGRVNGLRLSPVDDQLLFNGTRAEIPQGTAPSEVWLWQPGMEAPVSLTEDLDRSCRGLTWSACGGAIYLQKDDRAGSKIFRRTLANGKLGEEEHLCSGAISTIDNFAVAQNGTLVYTGSNEYTMPQIYCYQEGKEALRLTAVNQDYLEEGFFLPAETLHFKGPDNWDVEGFVIKPKGFEGKPVPTILNIHGGPTGVYNRNFNSSFQMMAHAGYAVVYINCRGSVSYGTKFAQGVCKDWGGGDFGDIMAGLDLAVEKGIADPNKLGVMGWSYGGYMTCWTVTQTARFKAAIGGANISSIYALYGNSDIGAAYDEALMGGAAFDLEELYMSRSAIRHVRKVTTPIMLLHGEADIRCPIDQSEVFYTALKRLGKEVVFVRYPEQYHGLVKPTYQLDRWERTMAWFAHYLV